MKILGIETSCDETAAAIVENGTTIISNSVVSQIDIHAAYGGVVPEIAARSHIESILPVIHAATDHHTFDAIAVTHTPGLNGSLLIGTLTARTIALLTGKPLYPTHHLKSHIYANWLETEHPPQFPLIALVVSGGHTQLIYMPDHNTFEIIGTTLDDAVGEAFDKAAKILGLPYPGGPSIALAASKSNLHNLGKTGESGRNFDIIPKCERVSSPACWSDRANTCRNDIKITPLERQLCADYANQTYSLPIPKVSGLDFSFSGLKTALLRAAQKAVDQPITTPSQNLPSLLADTHRHNFAHTFQTTAVEILVEKLAKAVENYHPKSIVLAGGVSANQLLREKVQQKFADQPFSIHYPQLKYCGDNAAMVASAAYFSIKNGTTPPTDPLALDISPHSPIC